MSVVTRCFVARLAKSWQILCRRITPSQIMIRASIQGVKHCQARTTSPAGPVRPGSQIRLDQDHQARFLSPLESRSRRRCSRNPASLVRPVPASPSAEMVSFSACETTGAA